MLRDLMDSWKAFVYNAGCGTVFPAESCQDAWRSDQSMRGYDNGNWGKLCVHMRSLFPNFKYTTVLWLMCSHSSQNLSFEPWRAAAFSISLDTLGWDVTSLEFGVELIVCVKQVTARSNPHSAAGRLRSSLPRSGLTALSVGPAQPASPISPDG